MNEQQQTALTETKAPNIFGEPTPTHAAETLQQQPVRRSVFFADENLVVNTSLRRAQDLRFAINTELRNKNKDRFFAYQELDESIPDTTHRIWKTPFRAVSHVGVSTWQAGERLLSGAVWAALDWYEYGARGREASRTYREKLAEMEKEALTVLGAQTQDQRKNELRRQYLAELEQIQADYEDNRKHGRNALLIMEENHRAFREHAGIEKNEYDGFIYDFFGAGGSLAMAIGLTALTGSPTAAAVVFGSTAGQQDYEEALRNGVSPQRALLAGIGGGVFEGGIELLGMELLFKSLSKTGVLGRIAASALSEGSEEAAQTTAEEIIMQNFGGRRQDFEETLKGIGYSFVLGSLTAAPVAVLVNRASAQLQEKGIEKERADKMAISIAKAVGLPENKAAVHDVLSNATSPLIYPKGDVLQGAKEFKDAIVAARNPDRETVRAMYNAAEKAEQNARAAGMDEEEAELIGALEQARFNTMHNQAGLKVGDFEETQIEFADLPDQNAVQEKADAAVKEDLEKARAKWKQEYEEAMARRQAEDAEANEELDRRIAEAGLSADDFFFQESAYNAGEADTNTAEFKQFFNDSKVVDEQKQPLVVYHAAANDFNVFDKNKTQTPVFWFTADKKSLFDGRTSTNAKGGIKKVMEVYLSIKNPANSEQYENFTIDQLKARGFDGVKLTKKDGYSSDLYIAFEPTQIKSVYNRGTFDSSNPNIYMQEKYTPAARVNPEEITEVHNQVTGEVIPLEMNPNLKPFVPVEIESDFLPMAKNANGGKRQVLEAFFGKEFDANSKVIVKKDGKNFIVSHNSVKKMYNTALTNVMDNTEKTITGQERRQLYHDASEQVAQALKVFDSAQLVLSHKDVKNVKDRTIHRYANVFVYKGKPYYAMFVSKQDGTLDDLYLYDFQAGNKVTTGISSGNKAPSQQWSNTSVSEIVRFVKRKIAKYNKNTKTGTTLELLQENLFDMQLGLFDGQQSLFDTQASVEEDQGQTQEEQDLKETADSLFTEEELKETLPPFKPTQKPERIEDFGEKILGARKDLWGKYSQAMTEEIKGDVKDITLSKFFPEPNYEAAIERGITVEQLAIVKALRDSIPAKPQLFSRAQRWVEGLKAARETSNQVLNNPNMVDEIKRLNQVFAKTHTLDSARSRIELYLALGYPAFTKAKNYALRIYNCLYYKGVRYDRPTPIYELTRGYYRVFGGPDFGEVVEHARKLLTENATTGKAPTKLDIYQMRATGEIIIGKKIASGKFIDLKGGFTRVKDASDYLRENRAHLEALLEEKRKTPATRGTTNAPRVGKEYRPNNTVVTPERFSQEFGFRGVQFGNWVEQGRRAEDLNRAYDALLDMANIIKVPSRALSLDGTLGLAFGARGHSGAAAHYESDQVVINLTKQHGAGSLAHEWWHALDNYFGKKGRYGMITEAPNYYDDVRPELRQAYEQVVRATRTAIAKRSSEMDKTRTKDYWSSNTEMTARAYESYIIYKGKEQGYSNDYLANVLSQAAFMGDKNAYPYPLPAEMPPLVEAFDNFFNVLQTKPSARGYTLYEEPDMMEPEIAQAEIAQAETAQPVFLGKVAFDFDRNRAIISAAKQANKSTALHEFFHVYERDLYRAEQQTQEADFLQMMQDLRTIHAGSYDFVIKYISKTKLLKEPQRERILKDIKDRGGKEFIKQLAFAKEPMDISPDLTARFVARAFHEHFAQQAERYFMKGQAPSPMYKKLFDRFSEWLREIYGALAGKEISPDVQKFFDKLLTREARRVDSKVFTGKVEQLRAQVSNIRQGSPKGNFSLEQIKALAQTLEMAAPQKPKTHLLKELRRYGAEYANAGRIDAESFKNARIFNKKGGIGDDPARWLMEHGYLSAPDNSQQLTYEDMDRLNEQAYDLIERAMDGEMIYPAGQEQAVADYENYLQLMDTVREVWGDPREARKTLKAILALEEKGYRVVEKKDLTALSLRLGELNRLADRLDNKSQTVKQKEEAEAQTLDAARKIRRRIVEELEKRQLEGKADIVKGLKEAKTFDDIQTATARALDFLESAYDKTAAGIEEKRRTDLPTTNWDNVRAQLLRAYTESVGNVDEKVKEAWRVRTLVTTGHVRQYGWSDEEIKRRRQQSEKILAEAEPKMESALMWATERVLRNIGGIESDQIRRLIQTHAKSATRLRVFYKGNIDKLVERARNFQEDNYKKYMNKKIQEILNLNLFDKRGNLRKAMVDPKTLDALQELKRVAHMGPQSAADELAARMTRFAEQPAGPTDKIINELLSIQAYDRKEVSMQLYKQAYDDISELRKSGRSARNLQKMIMDFRTEQDKSELLVAIQKNKKAGLLKRTYASWIANWESFLEVATDTATKEKYSMLNAEADTITHSWQRRTEIMEGVKRIYKLSSNRAVQDKMNELRKEKYTFTNYALVDKNTDQQVFIRRTGEPFKEELSKMQILTAAIYYKNDALADRLTQQYGNEQLMDMWNLLDKQDMELADFLQKEAEKSYSQINEVFVKERGYDLPRVQNYFPSVTERVESELDFLHAAANMSKNPSFIKMRANSQFIQMKLENPFGILFRHIDRAADYHFKAEKMNQIRRIFKSPVVKPALIENLGEDVYRRMLELIDQFSVSKQTLKYDIDKIGDWLTNNYVKGAIALKPTIAIKQLVSAMNYAEQMPSTKWVAGFTDAIMHPKKTIKFMMDGDPYLKTRYESGSMNEALARATADANAITARGKFVRFTDLLTINTRLGDMGAICFGGKPYVDYLMKKGMSKEEAFAEFRKATLRSQQSNTRSSLSTLQARDMNFLIRGLFAFKNTPQQYVRKIADAIIQYQRGEIDKKQLAKVVALYGLLNSWTYSMLTTLGLVAWYYDDDDAAEILTDELLFSPFTQMAGALPILDMAVGQAANVAKAKMFDHRVRLERPELPIVSELFRIAGKALKEDVTGEDVMDMLVTSGQIFGGLPTKYVKGFVTGSADIVSGENPMRGFLQAVGYTENRAQIATNTKE